MNATETGRLEEVDVLRGLAALVVVVSHYTMLSVKHFHEAPFGLRLDTIYGFYAVQLFFVISGFVISLSVERSRTWRDFAFSRFSRLYPTYWTALTLMVVVELLVFGKEPWISGYFANLTMLQEFIGFGNLDNVFWSLTVEIAFYAIMAALFAAGLLSRIQVVMGIWLALACLWSLVHQYLGIELPAFLPRFLILQHVPFFVAGITFYRITVKGLNAPRLALLLAALAAAGLIHWLPPDAGPLAVAWTDVLRRLGIAVLVFTIFGLAVAAKLPFAVSKVTLWLGAISYPLYLSHYNLGFSTIQRLREYGVPVWLVFALTLAGALGLATILSNLVERPAMRTLRHWYRTRERAVAVGS